jgi:hypothetical protein
VVVEVDLYCYQTFRGLVGDEVVEFGLSEGDFLKEISWTTIDIFSGMGNY